MKEAKAGRREEGEKKMEFMMPCQPNRQRSPSPAVSLPPPAAVSKEKSTVVVVHCAE